MSAERQEFTTDVEASVQQCFATITTFEKYPTWFSSVEKTAVLDRYRNGLAKRVRLHVNMKIRTVSYVLQYEYDRPTRMTWNAVEGDLESIEGGYVFERLAPKLSRVTCHQTVSVGFWIPGPLRALIERQALKQSVLEFKAAAEENAAKPRRTNARPRHTA